MINLERFAPQALSHEPYRWALIDGLFSDTARVELVRDFPRDHYKTVTGYDGEKGYEYEARSLISMGAEVASHEEHLSPGWRSLAVALLSPAYREALLRLTGVNLTGLPIEANVFHYGRRSWLGPHVDLKEKVLTHVFYFNEVWDESDGGCLTILRSNNMDDAVKIVPPLVGNSVVLVRSDNSWHAVSRVSDKCRTSRHSLTVTFYQPGSPSTMWPAGDTTPLHKYTGEHSAIGRWLRSQLFRIR